MSAKPPSFPSHTPSSFFFPSPSLPSTAPPSNPVLHQMDPSVLPQPRYPSTCIPSLMPPGVDPSSVDFRTFFPYIPNEVKHRKRTSRHQLKVLEDVFRKDTKPNAVLRKKLATELEMSPRAVQVRPVPPPPPPTRAHRTRRAPAGLVPEQVLFVLGSSSVVLTPHPQACQGKSSAQTRFRNHRPGQVDVSRHEKVSALPGTFSKQLLQLVHGDGEGQW